MQLFAVGLNHKTAPVELRERLSQWGAETQGLYQLLQKDQSPLKEGVLLSTCNRVEIYGVAPESSALDWTLNALNSLCGRHVQGQIFYRFSQGQAVQHLFEVAAGLDSLVIGEHEILGQVKNAYLKAQEQGFTGKLTNVLFQRALYVGKFVRTHTDVGQGSLSVASLAVDLAEHIFGRLSGTNVMILGAGKMAELSGRYLLSKKAQKIYVTNRTYERAVELSQRLGGEPFALEELYAKMELCDIVISSTASTDFIIQHDKVSEVMKRRKGRSLFFIDIAVPRDVEPTVHELDNVYLYNIDDLQTLVAKNLGQRTQEIAKAKNIVTEKTQEFVGWLESSFSGQQASLKHFSK